MKLSEQRVSMNKAFVRESDSDVRHCPFCGSLGQAVGRVTLDAWRNLDCDGQSRRFSKRSVLSQRLRVIRTI